MAGRHRNGRAPTPYVPAWLDAREHDVAAELTARYRGWFVIWGPYWRCWSAFAMFSTAPMVVHASDMGVLLTRMRAAEMAVHARRQ